MKILLVEDDATMNQNIKDAFLMEGFTVEVAYDGNIAEKFLRKESFDCVILDVNLPLKNGYEIAKSFRQINTSTPVIMLTAFDELEDKVQGYDSGADDYLTKPFYMKELLMRVKSLINRSQGAVSQELKESVEVLDIVINQKSKTVKRSDLEIILTPREYQILLKLALAKGAMVSKKELIREIWGGSFDANTNTIEVYINFLRKKIDKPFGSNLIKTKIGYGYFLDLE
ncbi:response regulator [Emticicia sp. CRIBPO]|uniref:response regulator transcription factor n=1 Tax=Emticicia sp. CRIBPO TaxID=2683258 RepID=UPI0014130732|nr:response regulator transcription factor [Emticicia sp. CRIBPO]NBA85602.1 response regulator [Emticicia sp. CRIBPO]